MRALPASAALLLLAAALALAASPAAAQKAGGGGPPLPTVCRFGWVPITFDREPWKQPLDPRRRPKLLNYRCTAACESLGLDAVMTSDSDLSLQKPLCYFERKRMLGAPYKIYGSWYAGEESADYESTCRGRVETGQPTQEWAMRWNETSEQMQFGYFCGCSGCTQNCWSSVPGATPRNPITGRFNCSAPSPGTPPPYPKANKYWPYWFTGPGFAPNTNPNSTEPDACNDPKWQGGVNNYPFAVCKGLTATFGEEWGTMDSDFSCKTYSSLVVDAPNFFCTTSASDKSVFPAPRVPGKPGRLMGIDPASRLDLVMGASEPTDKLPSRDMLQRLAPGVLTRTEEVLAH